MNTVSTKRQTAPGNKIDVIVVGGGAAGMFCAGTAAERGLSVLLIEKNEKLGRKIRDNELKRIPYMLIVGEKEAEQGLVSVRQQGAEEKGQMTIQEFADFINETVKKQMNAY